MLLVVLMYAFFASTFPIAKLALNATTSPLFLIAFRMVIAGVGLLTLAHASGAYLNNVKREDYKDFGAAAFFGIFLAFVAEFWSLQYIPSIKANLFFSLSPFITAILSFVLLKERLGWQKTCGLVIGFSGLLPLLINNVAGKSLSHYLVPSNWHDIVLIVSVISSAYAWFIIKRLMNRGYSLLFINGLIMLVGGIACSVLHLITNPVMFPVISWQPFLLYVALLIMISNVIGYFMYGHLLHHYSFTFLSFAGFLCPLFGLAYGKLLLGEPLLWFYGLSLICIFCGLLLFYLAEQKSS